MFNLAKLREEREKNGDKGFTLIELLVVVVIIGILIAIAIPLYLNYKKGANDKATQSDVRNAVAVFEQCNATNSTYPAALGSVASGGGTYDAMTGCSGAHLNFSSNTTLTYTPSPSGCLATAASVCTSYTIAGNSGDDGNNKTFTYDSTTGQTATS